MFQLLRSGLFNLVMIITVPLWVMAVFIVLPFGMRPRLAIAANWGQTNLKCLEWICGLRYEVEWRGTLPDGPCVTYWKHESTWETLAQLALFRVPQAWVLKREIMKIPFFGWGMYFLDPIAVDRKGGRKAVEQLRQQGQELIRQGRWVMIFPEGTRMMPGVTRRYGVGGALLAKDTGVPIVPICHNAGDFWGRAQFGKRPGTIRVVVGEPIETTDKSIGEINDAAQLWIERELRVLSPDRDYKHETPEDAVAASRHHRREKAARSTG
jgi:1-acyl-sn-glycerol-3-phosphate acyltransferase